MTEPLKSQVVFYSDYGDLGKVHIILPESNGSDADFDEEFDETLAFVMSVMNRRKRARAQGTETGTAKTEGLGPQDDGPVGNADAP